MATVGPQENITDKLPYRLSPSRAGDFTTCPAKFYFSTILRIRTPNTWATTKGSLAHEAFEKIFEHPAGSRTPELAVSYVRPAFDEISSKPNYQVIASLPPDELEKFLQEAEQAVVDWFKVEDPNRFEPVGREAKISVDVEKVPLLGILDRLDRVVTPKGQVKWIISDYKTGKVPAPDDRFLSDKFFAMRCYALLLEEAFGIIPDSLRLVYVIGASPDAVRVEPVTPASLSVQRKSIKSMWSKIKSSAKKGEFLCKTGPLCPWCDYQTICPAQNPQAESVPLDIEPNALWTPVDFSLFPKKSSKNKTDSSPPPSASYDNAPVEVEPPLDLYVPESSGSSRTANNQPARTAKPAPRSGLNSNGFSDDDPFDLSDPGPGKSYPSPLMPQSPKRDQASRRPASRFPDSSQPLAPDELPF